MSSPAFAPTHATGPRTKAGKATSSQNALKHGLASGTLLLPDEDPAEFEALHQSLITDHAPTSATETLVVHDMAKHHWLMDRAIRLQVEAFTTNDMNKLAVLLRYQNANHRAFHKSLAILLSNRKQFVSQPKPDQDLAAFEHDFEALLHSPFTTTHQDKFAEKYNIQRNPTPQTNARLPRNKR